MAANGRQISYAHDDNDAASKEERLKKLKSELREHIRFLGGYELLSQDWLRMAESLQQIANVAFMEQQMIAPSENPLDQQGKNREGTLWDQQKDELAIRIILEEGKLNLLLRLLHIYKEAMRQPDAAKVKLEAATELGCEVRAIEARCRIFEFSVGQLLSLALRHSEAMQIIDLPELLVHCKECVQFATTSLSEEKKNDPSFDRCQESMILQYFGAIGTNFEKLDEDRVMDLLDENKIIPSLVEHIHSLAPYLAADHIAASLIFFSSIMGSDAYRTDADRFVPSKETKQQLLDLQAMFVPEMIKAHAVQKKTIQALLDNFAKFERQVGKSAAKSQALRMAALAPLAAV